MLMLNLVEPARLEGKLKEELEKLVGLERIDYLLQRSDELIEVMGRDGRSIALVRWNEDSEELSVEEVWQH
jgi:hypothetical protein